MIWQTYVPSRIGDLKLVANDEALLRVEFMQSVILSREDGEGSRNAHIKQAMRQLEEYFAGIRKQFELTLAPKGTPFQLEVWRALQQIPYGETCTYAGIARAIGRPNAVRAVGAANGANPIPIIIPCHRVIGTNGSLTGFGGGISVKRRLLDLEAGAAPHPAFGHPLPASRGEG